MHPCGVLPCKIKMCVGNEGCVFAGLFSLYRHQTLINDLIYNHITRDEVLKGHSDGFESCCVCILYIYIHIKLIHTSKKYLVK